VTFTGLQLRLEGVPITLPFLATGSYELTYGEGVRRLRLKCGIPEHLCGISTDLAHGGTCDLHFHFLI
jgi:hypothetical protein